MESLLNYKLNYYKTLCLVDLFSIHASMGSIFHERIDNQHKYRERWDPKVRKDNTDADLRIEAIHCPLPH